MNPEVRDLIQRVLTNEIPLDVFYARMSQLGVLPSEAQTMLSTAAGGAQQGLDPALESARSQPLGDADRAMVQRAQEAASRPATVPAPAPAAIAARPRTAAAPAVAENPYAGMTPAEEAVARAQDISSRRFWGPPGPAPETPVNERRPSYQRLAGLGARTQAIDPQRSGPAQTALDIALQRIGPQAATAPYYGGDDAIPGQAFNAVSQSYYGQDDLPIGTAFNPAYTGDEQRFRPSGGTIQQASNVAKARTAAAPQVASTDTERSAEGPSLLAQIIRGRFGEAAKGSPYDDRLTPYQEERDRMGGMAKGGSVEAKPVKADPLHKALEIIHHLIRRG